MTGPGLRVPIVVRSRPDRPTVLLRPVVVEGAPSELAYRLRAPDIEVMCADLLPRRESLRLAQILAPTPEHAQVPLEGRSFELALALATLGAAHDKPLRGEVIATGELDSAGSGTIKQVDCLELKLRRALEELRESPGAQVLYPACQSPAGNAPGRIDDARLAELRREFPSLEEQLRPVATLDEAANLAFEEIDLRPSPTAATRLELERLRYERPRADELFRVAARLFEEAGQYGEKAQLGVVVRYHALTTAYHAARLLTADRRPIPAWPAARRLGGRELLDYLGDQAENLALSQQELIPRDMRAEHLNFRATACFETLDFLAGERLASAGLGFAEEQAGFEGEARKLHGTRALFRWRLALRALGTGARYAARHHLRDACADLDLALREATREGVENRNDRARVRLYGLNLQQVEAEVEGSSPDAIAAFEPTLREVLGRFWGEGEQAPPQQEPGWGLQLLYAQHRAAGRLGAILEHWRTRRELENCEVRPRDGHRPSLGEWVLAARLPCTEAMAALLLEAAVELGDREIAEEAVKAFAAQSPSLPVLARLWPAVWAPPEWRLDEVAWVRGWADGHQELPAGPEAAADDDWLLARLDELRECWSAGDRRGAARARRLVQLWLGEAAAPAPPAPAAAPGPRLVIEKGLTRKLEELPARSLALDGFVQGPAFDTARERYSLDHHAGCVRHATLSTCEMTVDALRVGLDPAGMTVFVNDLDADTILSSWLLARPLAARELTVERAVRDAGRLDALGPAARRGGLAPALRWALEPVLGQAAARTLRGLDAQAWRALMEQCFERLDRWHAAGAPRSSREMSVPHPARVAPRLLHQGDGWVLAESSMPLEGFAELYASVAAAAVVTREAPHGTHEYTVGKASEFVARFDVPEILAALRAAELEANPAQSPAHTWGGGSTIGGSPRNPDGSASVLGPERVAAVVGAVLARSGG